MLPLNDVFVSQILILGILFFITIRPVFKKLKNKDAPSLFAPIAFTLSVFHIINFGFQIQSIITLILSFVVFCVNGPALYRLTQKLTLRRYSSGFSIFSYFLAFLCVLCVILQIFFCPAYFNKEIQEKYQYTGSFTHGFTEKTDYFKRTSLVVTEWKTEEANNTVGIVYLSPIGTSPYDSSLRLERVAEKNIPVLCGDFNKNRIITPFMQRFDTPTRSETNNLLMQKKLELSALLKIAKTKYNTVIIIAEGNLNKIAQEEIKKNPDFIVDILSYNENPLVNDYYSNTIADYAAMNPLDFLLSSHKDWSSFSSMRKFATEKNIYEEFALLVEDSVQEVKR